MCIENKFSQTHRLTSYTTPTNNDLVLSVKYFLNVDHTQTITVSDIELRNTFIRCRQLIRTKTNHMTLPSPLETVLYQMFLHGDTRPMKVLAQQQKEMLEKIVDDLNSILLNKEEKETLFVDFALGGGEFGSYIEYYTSPAS